MPVFFPQVYLNNQRLNIKSFPEYVDLYLGAKDSGPARFHERINDRWELCVSATDGQFHQVHPDLLTLFATKRVFAR